MIRIIIITVLLSLAACTSKMAIPAPEEASLIKVSNPYILELPPVSKNSAAYMELLNKGNRDVSLIAVSSPASASASFHDHIHKNGLMMMEKLDKVAINSGESLNFKVGSLHIMLAGLKESLYKGDIVPLTFTFSDSSTLTINIPVRKRQ
ncbi:MAG: copper chaperone PCu(A)C [Deltaproteobacteria bacterium]|nr:copper chaperone PCu(A)C [Deltaproteobacteria bacterium]